ncbi:hypothetical protein G3M55_20600, partial [Streptomyces sp. SID8455]|nr:hypothetical protein [Streptomyces sp. SID8455]
LAAALETGADTVDTDGASRPPVEPEPDADDLPRTGQDTPRTGQDTPRTGERSPEPSGREDEGSQQPPLDYASLMPTFLKLLPEGLTVSGKVDSGGEFASVVVDDGQGATLVQINVQPGMGDVADEL